MTTPRLDPATLTRALLDLVRWAADDVDDEGRILASCDESGTAQLVEIGTDGSRTPLTALPGACWGAYEPGRRAVLVQHDRDGDEMWQLSLLDLGTPRSTPATLEDLEPVLRDPAYRHVLAHVDRRRMIYHTNRRNGVDMDVVSRDLASGEEHTLYDGGGYVGSCLPSHSGDVLAVLTLSDRPASTAIALAGPAGRSDLTDPGELASHSLAGWAADDTAVLLSSDHDRDFAAIQAVSPDGATWRTVLAADDHDLRARASHDGTALLVGHHQDGLDTLAVHEADGTLRCRVDLPPLALGGVVWSPDDSCIVVSYAGPTDPGSIARIDARSGAATVVHDGRDTLPAELRDALVEPTVHRVTAHDGERIPCFRYAAPEPSGAVVLHIHGGPESEAGRGFAPVVQLLALSGFDVLVPNVRGSSGYGKRWVGLDDVRLRLDSVADLAALHAWLPELGLDPARAALWGGSYGGYMVLAGVSMQPELWAAGVDIVGISSLVTFLENTSPYRRAVREREYGSLADDRDFLVEASPLTHLDAIRAPLFVIHGANDPRVPLSEAEQIKAALDVKGVACELRVYHDEGHGLAKRVNRKDAYPAAVEFLSAQLTRRG